MKVGILGGGQLGMFLSIAAKQLGHTPLVLSPDPTASAKKFSDFTLGSLDDPTLLQGFARNLSVLTYEFEHLSVSVLKKAGVSPLLVPAIDALIVGQDRDLEKAKFRSLGMPTAPYLILRQETDLDAIANSIGFPCILKTTLQGYDGKGQRRVKSLEEAKQAWQDLAPHPLIAEQWVKFDRELSQIAVRSQSGEMAYYPLVENVHHDGILFSSVAPAPYTTPSLVTKAQSYVQRLMDELNYVGVLALELFQVQDELLVNEMAPRVHNSGHWTLEGAVCSQFENHIRAITGMPLGSTEVKLPTAMVNCVGEMPKAAVLNSIPGAAVYDYGKEARPGRKLGHLTFTAADEASLREKLNRFAESIGKKS